MVWLRFTTNGKVFVRLSDQSWSVKQEQEHESLLEELQREWGRSGKGWRTGKVWRSVEQWWSGGGVANGGGVVNDGKQKKNSALRRP